MKKTLIIRNFGSLGDMLMMAPALREYSKKNKIFLAIPKSFFDVFLNLKYIHKLIPSNSINKISYDKIIDLTDYEFNFEQIFQPQISKPKTKLFADALNVKIKNHSLDIVINKKENKWIKKYLDKHNPDNKKIVLIGVRSANPTRDWPIINWKKLIGRLKKLNYKIVIVDKELKWDDEEIFFFNNHTIRELFSLASKSKFIICHDSGLLHIGGALKINTLGIFGPTNPKIRCIYENSHWICNNIGIEFCWYNRNKNAEYINSIGVSDVERKFMEIVNNETK